LNSLFVTQSATSAFEMSHLKKNIGTQISLPKLIHSTINIVKGLPPAGPVLVSSAFGEGILVSPKAGETSARPTRPMYRVFNVQYMEKVVATFSMHYKLRQKVAQ
jgi:hypothetical protein